MRQKNNLGKITKVKRHIQIRKKEFSNFRFVGVEKSGFVERFPELSVFFKACRALYDEMICIFPYFCPCEIIVREIREISF